jgi:methionyl-tRNA formyltransferase
MRLAFLGTPEAAVPSLRALVGSGHDVAMVITRPDRKRGRGGQVTPSPVKACAQELGLTIGHRLSDLDDLNVERGVVVAYGRLIPAEVLKRIPMLNVHFSLLPRWRGAAPVERAILAGDVETGVSIMTLDEDLDTGPVHLEKRVEIDAKSLSSLLGELAAIGAHALTEVLDSPELLARPRPQRGEVTFADKLTKEDRHLNPTFSAAQLLRIVQLGQAFAFVGDRRLLVESAAAFRMGQALTVTSERGVAAERASDGVTAGSIALRFGRVLMGAADGAISLDRVRPESAKPMSATSWWSGARFGSDFVQWT